MRQASSAEGRGHLLPIWAQATRMTRPPCSNFVSSCCSDCKRSWIRSIFAAGSSAWRLMAFRFWDDPQEREVPPHLCTGWKMTVKNGSGHCRLAAAIDLHCSFDNEQEDWSSNLLMAFSGATPDPFGSRKAMANLCHAQPAGSPAPLVHLGSAGGCICALGFKVCRRQSCCIFSIRHPCLDSTGIRPTKCSNGPVMTSCTLGMSISTNICFWKKTESWTT